MVRNMHLHAVKKKCKDCVACCYIILHKYNLYQCAYPNLTLIYKHLLTLSVTQVSCERTFSILKYILNRLRSSLTQENLEAFMLMSIEKSALYELKNEEIIDKLAEKSKLLYKLLIEC